MKSVLNADVELECTAAPRRFASFSPKQKTAILRNWALMKISFHGAHIRGVLQDKEQRDLFNSCIEQIVKQIKASQ